MISTASIVKTLSLNFKREGWSVAHFYIYRPSMIESFGVGDRLNTKSNKDGVVFLPEPHLCLTCREIGVLFEIDYKYSKTAICNILKIKNTEDKDLYLKKYFRGMIPKRLLYGFALPNTPVHVERAKRHCDELDFIACVSRKYELSFLKSTALKGLGNFR